MEYKEWGVIVQTSSGKNYAYITETNHIVTLESDWYHAIPIEQKEERVWQALCEAEEIIGQMPESFEWPLSEEEYEVKLKDNLSSIVLEITQECTLRCEYCIYSGNYKNVRTHSNCHMTQEMVKQSLDYYAEHSKQSQNIAISFYGGEALMRFDIVKYAVTYAKEIFLNKSLSFRISSNGTTLTQSIIEWLNENQDIEVVVTVNGFSHDRYRKFPNGEGSLETILKNLRGIRQHYPNLWNRIHFLANIVSLQELLELRRFYMEEIGKPPLLITGILEYGGNEQIKKITQVQDTVEVKEEVYRLYCDMQDSYLKPYFHTEMSEICKRPIGRREKVCQITACCMPFLSSLFVSADGKFGLCERVGVWKDCGDIYRGIDMAYIRRIKKEAVNLFQDRCANCWCQRLCTICFKDFETMENGGIMLPEIFCERMKENVKHTLRLFCENPIRRE